MQITLDSTYGSMSLTSSHLRYLLTIYEVAREFPVVSSANIARKLNVSKPSVSTMLDCLMKKNLLVKERYGKVYLTENGDSSYGDSDHHRNAGCANRGEFFF